MDPNWKQFVVVEFIDTAEVATVLKSWIQENEVSGALECFWPDQSNSVRKALVSNKEPLPTWDKWRIRVLTSCDTFKEALLKEKRAQDTSDLASCAESDTGKGRRVRKPNHRLFSDSESDGSEDIPSPKLKRPRESTTTILTPRSSSSSKSSVSSRCCLNERSEGILPSVVESPSSSKNCNHGGACLKMQEQQERMERTLQLMRMEVRELLDMVSQIAKAPHSKVLASLENDSRTKFSKQFPIASLEDFLQLEDSLENEENTNLMIEFFSKVGGNSLEDSVRRSLVRLLTNEVAVNFSWEGRKGKRALNNLSVVKILERVLSAVYGSSFTNKVFETRLREWFRQAGTRIFNKNKKPIV